MENVSFEPKVIRLASSGRLLVFVSGAAVFLALVDLLVAPQIRYHGEVSPTALDVAGKCCNAVSTRPQQMSVQIHLRFSPV